MAGRVPPELFERICGYIGDEKLEWTEDLEDDRYVAPRPTHSGSASLTARYWSDRIRPYMFNEVSLRSREDALSFISIVLPPVPSSLPNISAYITEIALEHRLPSPPWIHTILDFLSRGIIPNLQRISLRTSGPFPSGEGGQMVEVRSPYYEDLPRSLPVPPNLPLEEHTLKHLNFHVFKYLLAAIESLRSSHILCTGLTWPEADTALPLIIPASTHTRRLRKPRAYFVQVNNCTAVWPFTWCLVTTRPPSTGGYDPLRPLYVEKAELLKVVRMVQLISDSCPCRWCTGKARASQGSGYKLQHRAYYLRKQPDLIAKRGCIEVGSTWINHKLIVHVEATGFVHEIVFFLDLREVTGESSLPAAAAASGFDWGILDRQCSAFGPTMTRFRICLDNVDEPFVRRYASYVIAQMPVIHSANKLSFSYSTPRRDSSHDNQYKEWTPDQQAVEGITQSDNWEPLCPELFDPFYNPRRISRRHTV